MCDVLQIARSTFYYESKVQPQEDTLAEAIVFNQSGRFFSPVVTVIEAVSIFILLKRIIKIPIVKTLYIIKSPAYTPGRDEVIKFWSE